jgi:hypothetical protein
MVVLLAARIGFLLANLSAEKKLLGIARVWLFNFCPRWFASEI